MTKAELRGQLDKANDQIEVLKLRQRITDVEMDKLLDRIEPVWGNCRHGCPPAYLNKNGYCSKSCEMGLERGRLD